MTLKIQPKIDLNDMYKGNSLRQSTLDLFQTCYIVL